MSERLQTPASQPTVWLWQNDNGRQTLSVDWDKEPHWSFGWVDVVLAGLRKRHKVAKQRDIEGPADERLWHGTVDGTPIDIYLDGGFAIDITPTDAKDERLLATLLATLRETLDAIEN